MTPSRRDVLAALLGASGLALQGGCRRRVVAGEVVGADVAFGHALRTDVPVVEASGHEERTGVVIVGGGMAGLSAAWRLSSDARVPFVVLELEAEPGGTSRSGHNDVSGFPWGAHYVPVPSADNRVLLRLLREADVIDPERSRSQGRPTGRQSSLIVEPQERLFYRGRWHEGLLPRSALSPRDVFELHRFDEEVARWVGWRDAAGRRAFTLPVAAGSDDAEVTALDRISMATWLDQRGFRSIPLRWFVDLACRDDYGCNIDTTSAWAGLFYFAARVPRPFADSAPFLTWPEGNGRLVQHLRHRIAPHVRCEQLVIDILPRESDVVVTVLDGPGRTPRRIVSDRVIAAIPRFIQNRVLRPFRDTPPEGPAFDTSPWMVANLTLSRRPANRGFGPAWDNVLYDSPSLGYVTASHQRGRSFGPTVWTYYYPLTDADPKRAREKLLSATREEWADVILTDLSRAHPDIDACVERIDLMRWGHAMIRPTPGFVWCEARRRASEPKFGKIHFAHTELSAVPLIEEALFHGVRAAEEVIGARFGAVRSWL